MTINYKLNENDFLTHQLFIASKSDRIKKKRRRNKVIVPLIYAVFGLLFFFDEKFSLAIIFCIIGILWLFLYPLWESRHYISHYKGFIKENYKERIGRNISLEFRNDFIVAKDSGSESQVLITELEEINEIQSVIFIRLKDGQSFILSKTTITNIGYVTTKLKEIAADLKIKYNFDEKWQWK